MGELQGWISIWVAMVAAVFVPAGVAAVRMGVRITSVEARMELLQQLDERLGALDQGLKDIGTRLARIEGRLGGEK